MVNCKKCTVFVKRKAPLIQVDNCEEPKLILFNPCVVDKPRIMSCTTTNFSIDAQQEDKEDSEWKSINIPYQMETEINTEDYSFKNTLVGL